MVNVLNIWYEWRGVFKNFLPARLPSVHLPLLKRRKRKGIQWSANFICGRQASYLHDIQSTTFQFVFCSNKNRTNNTQITVLFNLQVSFIIFTCVLSYELMSLLNGMSLYFILISCSSNYFYVKRLRCAFVWCDYFSVGCYKWQYIARKVSCPSLMCMYILDPEKHAPALFLPKKTPV